MEVFGGLLGEQVDLVERGALDVLCEQWSLPSTVPVPAVDDRRSQRCGHP